MRPLRVLLATAIVTLGLPAGALAHGDGPTHYLETFDLYPGFSPAPSPNVELELMGFIDAARRAGAPVKVGLANEGDVTDRPQVLRRPQAYAESVAAEIDARVPVIIVTPHGVGVAGPGPRVRVELPLHANSDSMAKTATDAVRAVAEAAGHPLPAEVPPARLAVPPASASPAPETGGGFDGWRPIAVFAVVFGGAALLYELRMRLSRRRRLDPASSPH